MGASGGSKLVVDGEVGGCTRFAAVGERCFILASASRVSFSHHTGESQASCRGRASHAALAFCRATLDARSGVAACIALAKGPRGECAAAAAAATVAAAVPAAVTASLAVRICSGTRSQASVTSTFATWGKALAGAVMRCRYAAASSTPRLARCATPELPT